jgi:hypothetical protein
MPQLPGIQKKMEYMPFASASSWQMPSTNDSQGYPASQPHPTHCSVSRGHSHCPAALRAGTLFLSLPSAHETELVVVEVVVVVVVVVVTVVAVGGPPGEGVGVVKPAEVVEGGGVDVGLPPCRSPQVGNDKESKIKPRRRSERLLQIDVYHDRRDGTPCRNIIDDLQKPR